MHRYSRWRCYGSASIGNEAEIQIPPEARQALGIDDGEEMAVFGSGKGHITLVKAEVAREFVGQALSDMAELERQIRADGGAAEGARPAGTVDEEDDG
ncbi:MAG: hypothetical protein ACE5JM_16785 [Armatimonadota bacterium]